MTDFFDFLSSKSSQPQAANTNSRPLTLVTQDPKTPPALSLLLLQNISEIPLFLPEWSSLELPLAGLQDCSPNLRELLETHEHGDHPNDAHMLVKEVMVVNNLQLWQETYLGMLLPCSDAALEFLPATNPEFFLFDASNSLNIFGTRGSLTLRAGPLYL